jgi:hypothetical protein
VYKSARNGRNNCTKEAMKTLSQYIVEHTDRNACTCGKCVVSGEDKQLSGHTVDMFFFDVCAKDNPDADTFRKLIVKQGEINPFDGKEHSYIELGGWLGDQGLALQFMGLGVILGLWQVMHPVNMLKLERQNPLAQQMAGMGMVSILAGESK